ncbi:MAG: acylphosphatase [Nitrospinota bacterium]|nr:acylphosphatase [Nitrospinota bacterium]
MGIERAHVLVFGLVQGVFFRATCRETAQRIDGITGWVRNLPDGRVEVVAEGERESLDILVGWLRHGPPGASVEGLDVTWEMATGEFSGFEVSY